MNRKESVYTNLLSLVDHVLLDETVQTCYDLIHESEQTTFIDIIEQLDAFRAKLRQHEAQNELPTNIDDLGSIIQQLKNTFHIIPDYRFSEILVITEIIKKLATEDDSSPLNTNVNGNFTLQKLASPLYLQYFNFSELDPLKLEDSAFFFTLSDPEGFNMFLHTEPIQLDILFHLLQHVGSLGNDLDMTGQYLLIKQGITGNAAETCLKLHIIRSGKYFHQPYQYLRPINVNPLRRIDPTRGYQQFHETLVIISEYNYQSDILDKYLRLYHVIENFMYRLPLVDLERRNRTNFSIRDFKRMYSQISSIELDVLKSLFKKVLTEPFDTHDTFGTFIFKSWQGLSPGFISDETKIDDLLSALNLSISKFAGVSHSAQSNLHNFLAQIVYSYRNSLVHNKDTEFHLTHEVLLAHPTLGNTANIVLEEFLIPCLEELIFYLIIEENSIVRFNNSKMALWND